MLKILIACGIIIVMLILFCRFVERRHKVLCFKILGLIVGISVIATGGYLLWHNKLENDKKNWVSIKEPIVYYESIKETDKLAEAAFEETKNNFVYRFEKMSLEQISKVKNLFLSLYLDKKTSVYSDLVRSSNAEDEIRMNYMIANEPEKAKMIEKLKPFELKRADQYIKEMASWKEDDPWVPFILRTWIRSFETIEAKKHLEAKIPPKYKKSDQWVEEMEKFAEGVVMKKKNDNFAMDTSISFYICNSRKIPLDLIEFDVSGLEEGRSTPHSIVKIVDESASQNSTRMKSDIIIDGGKCTIVVWTGKYLFFDKYVVNEIYAKWNDGEVSTKTRNLKVPIISGSGVPVNPKESNH